MPHCARLGVKSFMTPRLAAAVVVWAVLLTDARPASALSCVDVPLAKVAAEAGAVFEATVVSVRLHPAVRTPDGLVSVSSSGRPVTVTVGDVRAIRGAAPTTLESVERVLETGRRYLVIALASRTQPGCGTSGPARVTCAPQRGLRRFGNGSIRCPARHRAGVCSALSCNEARETMSRRGHRSLALA